MGSFWKPSKPPEEAHPIGVGRICAKLCQLMSLEIEGLEQFYPEGFGVFEEGLLHASMITQVLLSSSLAS